MKKSSPQTYTLSNQQNSSKQNKNFQHSKKLLNNPVPLMQIISFWTIFQEYRKQNLVLHTEVLYKKKKQLNSELEIQLCGGKNENKNIGKKSIPFCVFVCVCLQCACSFSSIENHIELCVLCVIQLFAAIINPLRVVVVVVIVFVSV